MSIFRLRARLRSLLAPSQDVVTRLPALCETVPPDAVARLEAKRRERDIGVDQNHDVGCVYRYGAIPDGGRFTCKCKAWPIEDQPETVVETLAVPETDYPIG